MGVRSVRIDVIVWMVAALLAPAVAARAET